MLGLQVDAPLDGVIELFAAVFEDIDSLGVADAGKVVGHDIMQSFKQSLVNKGVKKLHLLRAAFQGAVDDILDHRLGGVHVIVEVGKRHLGLYHPKLGCVTLGVGNLRSEGRTEGVDIAERHCEVFAVELTGNGEVGAFSEEVLGEIDLAVLGAGQIVEVKGGDSEHLTCALAVRARDDGGVDIDKAALPEKLVNRLRGYAANSEHCGKEVGAWSEVLDGAQKFNAVTLFL